MPTTGKKKMKPELIKVTEKADLQHCFLIRKIVYIEEQRIPEKDEFDEFDEGAVHFLAFWNDIPAGTARWRVTEGNKAKLERFAVLKDFRKKGIASALIKAVLRDVYNQGIFEKVYLHAQVEVLPLYQHFGFVPVGDQFDECGILHQGMELKYERN